MQLNGVEPRLLKGRQYFRPRRIHKDADFAKSHR